MYIDSFVCLLWFLEVFLKRPTHVTDMPMDYLFASDIEQMLWVSLN